jgi:hypothetical protein
VETNLIILIFKFKNRLTRKANFCERLHLRIKIIFSGTKKELRKPKNAFPELKNSRKAFELLELYNAKTGLKSQVIILY